MDWKIFLQKYFFKNCNCRFANVNAVGSISLSRTHSDITQDKEKSVYAGFHKRKHVVNSLLLYSCWSIFVGYSLSKEQTKRSDQVDTSRNEAWHNWRFRCIGSNLDGIIDDSQKAEVDWQNLWLPISHSQSCALLTLLCVWHPTCHKMAPNMPLPVTPAVLLLSNS